MPVLISNNADIAWAKPFPHDHIFQIASNNHIIVIYKDTVSGNLYYRTSPDFGATWTAATVLPGSPTPASLHVIELIDDVLYMWFSGATVRLYTAPYDTSTNLLGAQTVHSYAFTGITSELVAAVYADGAWHVSFVIVRGATRSIGLFRTPGFDGSLATFQQFIDLNYSHTGLNVLRIVAVSGALYISWYDPATKRMYLAPIVRGAGNYVWTPANLELAATLTDSTALFEVVSELDGSQTFILAHDGLLYALVRTATNTYGLPIVLRAQIQPGQIPAVILDGTDLYVGYETIVNQSNGETYMLKRTGGRWLLPILLAGGANSGFGLPVVNIEALLYRDTTHHLYFLGWARSGAPHAPTNLAPVGNVSTTTPTLTWTSNPYSPTDPTKSHQVLTSRVSDSAVMDDSGEVFDGTTAYNVPGGAGLVANTAYQFQVREKDSLSALGAGTWGPYSTYAVFTPIHAAVDTIETVTSGGVTESSFPATIVGADIQAHVGHTQPDGDATNAYRLLLYDTDDVTVLAQTAFQALVPSIAAGSPFDTIDWTSGKVANGHTYHLSVQSADAVTGVISESAHVRLTTAFAPPPAVTGLTATPNDDEGEITLAWSNPGEAIRTVVEWRPHTETGKVLSWLPLGPSGELWNHVVTANQAPQLQADYRVTVYDALGIASTPAVVSGVLLGNALDYAGIWVNDVNDVHNRKIYIGYPDNWDALKRDRAYAMQEWVPQGAKLPIQSFGLTEYWILGTSNALKIFFPATDIDAQGGIHYGADNRDMAISLADSHAVLTYRDRRFPTPLYVKFIAYEDQPNDDVNTDLTLELHQTSYFAPLPVVGSLV